MLNSPLREEPREQRAAVIPSRHESSLISWLESNGRMIGRDTARDVTQDPAYLDEEDSDISGLTDTEDLSYDLGDDDDGPDLEDS